jgi:hypothetical protein
MGGQCKTCGEEEICHENLEDKNGQDALPTENKKVG